MVWYIYKLRCSTPPIVYPDIKTIGKLTHRRILDSLIVICLVHLEHRNRQMKSSWQISISLSSVERGRILDFQTLLRSKCVVLRRNSCHYGNFILHNFVTPGHSKHMVDMFHCDPWVSRSCVSYSMVWPDVELAKHAPRMMCCAPLSRIYGFNFLFMGFVIVGTSLNEKCSPGTSFCFSELFDVTFTPINTPLFSFVKSLCHSYCFTVARLMIADW